MATYKQLTAQLEQLHKEVAAAREKEAAQAAAEIREKIAEYGLTAKDLGLAAGPGRGRPAATAPSVSKPPLPPKYRNPKTGETWSGRGRAPGWLVGKNRDQYLA